jgi:membrane protease YdiL (CAAX protease family)
MQGLNTVIVFALPALLYARLTFREQPLYFLGFRGAGKNIFYGLAVAILLLSFPVEGWLGQLNKGIPLPSWMLRMEEDTDKQLDIFLRVGSPVDVYINLFLIALLPAICEEACFRGALQRILINAFRSPWAGIIATGIFFSAFHMQFQGFLPRMFLGILLGAIYWYSGSLWVSILAHFFYNGVQVLAVSFYPKMIHENPSVPIYTALISLVIIVGLLLVVRRKSETTYARIYDPGDKEYDGFPS